jgi:hypothetical protein
VSRVFTNGVAVNNIESRVGIDTDGVTYHMSGTGMLKISVPTTTDLRLETTVGTPVNLIVSDFNLNMIRIG